MNQAQKQVEELVAAIFNIRQSVELTAAVKEIATSNASQSSGSYIIVTTRAYESAVIRTIDRTLEELALQFRQAGRRDSALFWNLVEPKLRDLAISFSRSASATAAARLRSTNSGALARVANQTMANIQQLVTARVHELRVKSQFITLKTPDDRRANGVPDVAVMMWFPNSQVDKPEELEGAKQRYEAIKEAVTEASNGLATVNNSADPEVIPQDRISASIEVWLEKSVVVICDLAGQRQNVYYEFGYTRAIGTDVLLTCPKADADKTKLHLEQWQRIGYADTAELKDKLIEKLKVLLPKYDLSGSI
jgi:hypothetical protein